MKLLNKEMPNNRSSYRMILSIVLFSLLYAVFEFLYFKVPDSFLLNVIYHYGLALPSALIINSIHPAEQVVAAQNILSSHGVALEVVRGCDGAGTFFLLIAAILTFSASFKSKLLGLLSGIVLLSAINLLRIIGLYFVMAYQSQWFTPIHTYFAPTFIIIVGCLFFASWAQYASVKRQ